MSSRLEASCLREKFLAKLYIQNGSTLGAGYSLTSSQGQGSRSAWKTHEVSLRSRKRQDSESIRLNLYMSVVVQGCHAVYRWIASFHCYVPCATSDRIESNKSTAKFFRREAIRALSLVLCKPLAREWNSMFSFPFLSGNRYNFFSTITILLDTTASGHRLNPR